MTTFHILPKAGQVIKLSDDLGNSWSFGIKYLLAGNRILCEWLGGEPVLTRTNDRDLKFSIPYEEGIFMVPAEVEEVLWDKREFKFALDKNYEFIQRRAYYRLPNPPMSVQYSVYSEPFIPATVVDVGGGGIGLIVDKAVKEGTKIDLQILLPDGNTAHAIGEAVRVFQAGNINGYSIGVVFRRISEANRDKIIRHIFNEQLLKSRLGE